MANRFLIVFLLLTLLAAACSSPQAPNEKPLVVATVGMLGDVLETVGGEHVEVRTLMGPGVDPHLYVPTRDDLILLSRADAVFFVGLNLEGRMIDAIRARSGEIPVVAIADYIPGETLLMDEESGEPDPHLWMDASVWSLVPGIASGQLSALVPGSSAALAVQATNLEATYREMHEQAVRTLSSIPENQRVLITAHDAFQYFGGAYGIEVHGIQGISTESEAGLADLNALVEMVTTRGIPAVFVESSLPARSVQALVEGARSRGHDVRIGGELYSDALGAAGSGGETYAGMFRHNVRTIALALGAESNELE